MRLETTLAFRSAVSGPVAWHRSVAGQFPLRAVALPVAVLLSFALLTMASPLAEAQSTDKLETQRKLEAGRRALQERRDAERKLAEDMGRIEADRAQLNDNLIETARLIQQGEKKLSDAEARLGELDVQEKILRGSLAKRHGSIAKLLGAMQRMGRNPPPVMITRREDALVMVRSAMLLASAFPQLRTQALELSGRLTDLARVMDEQKQETAKIRAENQRHTEARTRMSALLETKRQSLAEHQTSLARIRGEIQEISRDVNSLGELMAGIDKVIAREVARDVASLDPNQSGAGKPSRGDGASPSAKPGEAAKSGTSKDFVLAPSGRIAEGKKGRIKPAIPFAQAKGRLPLPAEGKRIIRFGEKAQSNNSNGIVIETRQAAQVISPLDGWIVFAGVFRSYGQILIINGGDGYHMLLAGLSQIDVQLGQFVLSGEPVGLMEGARGGGQAKSASSPVLYIELRKDGRPIDPSPWWLVESTQKVQG